MKHTNANSPMTEEQTRELWAEIKAAKQWISRLITRQQKLTSDGDPEILALVEESLTRHAQEPDKILTQAREMGTKHCRQFTMWYADIPFNLPERVTSRLYLHQYIRGVLESAQERLDELELELSTRGHAPTRDRIGRELVPLYGSKAAHKTAAGPKPKGDDVPPTPTA